jgi:nuclease S1
MRRGENKSLVRKTCNTGTANRLSIRSSGHILPVDCVERQDMSIFRIRHRIGIVATLLFMTLLSTPSVWSWSRIGHHVVARMAEERLTPHALVVVHGLLGPDVSLAGISTWADEQREIPRTGPWHYVNVPITESRYDSKFCQSGGCIVSKIEDFKRVLQNPNAGKIEKQRALKFVIHLIADLHQPLHVGDTGSRGGNLIQVRFYNAGSNLHRVWDLKMMERHTESEQVWLGELDSLVNPTNISQWSKGTIEDWATESLQAAKEAYCMPGTKMVMQSGANLGDDYCSMALPVIQRQLAKAGIRLAYTLNNIFK